MRASSTAALVLIGALTAGLAQPSEAGSRRRRPYPGQGNGQGNGQDNGQANEFSLQRRGGNGGASADHVTPPRAVIFGVRVRSGTYVDNVSFAWYQPQRTDNQYTQGDRTGVTRSYGGDGGGDAGWWTCPAGQGVIGIRGGSGDLVDRFGVICGDLTNPDPASHRNTYSPMWGGNGGGEFRDACPRGHLAVAFNVRSGDLVDSLQTVCLAAR